VNGKPSQRHALTYFSVGTDADDFMQNTNATILQKLLAQLDTMFDGQVSRYYVRHWIQNWNTVPYVECAYSDDWNENQASFASIIAELARHINQTLYFAGDHTEKDNVATVHGASLSGRRAAQQVLRND
jgi:monoamine oxidase